MFLVEVLEDSKYFPFLPRSDNEYMKDTLQGRQLLSLQTASWASPKVALTLQPGTHRNPPGSALRASWASQG